MKDRDNNNERKRAAAYLSVHESLLPIASDQNLLADLTRHLSTMQASLAYAAASIEELRKRSPKMACCPKMGTMLRLAEVMAPLEDRRTIASVYSVNIPNTMTLYGLIEDLKELELPKDLIPEAIKPLGEVEMMILVNDDGSYKYATVIK